MTVTERFATSRYYCLMPVYVRAGLAVTPQALRERYQLECVPIPEQSMCLYCITRRGGTQIPEIARHLQLLQAELEDEASDQTEDGR